MTSLVGILSSLVKILSSLEIHTVTLLPAKTSDRLINSEWKCCFLQESVIPSAITCTSASISVRNEGELKMKTQKTSRCASSFSR